MNVVYKDNVILSYHVVFIKKSVRHSLLLPILLSFNTMNKYPNLCVTCLCNDRKLVSLQEMSNILKYIHFSELKSLNGGICWECKNAIIKYYRFKNKALEVQRILSLKKKENQSPLTTLGSKVSLSYNYYYYYSNPLICGNKKKNNTHIKPQITNLDSEESETENSDNKEPETENSDSDLLESEINNIETDKESTDHDNVGPIHDTRKDIYSHITICTGKDSNTKYIEINPLPSLKKKPGVNQVRLASKRPNGRPRKPGPKSVYKLPQRKKNNKYAAAKYAKTCSKFIKVIRTEEEMIKHREDKRNQPNRKKMQFKCDFCVIGFLSKANYDAHMQIKHDKSIGPFVCDICKVRYETLKFLEGHRNKHYVYYKCKFCKYTSPVQSLMLNHCQEQHENDVDLNIHCKLCDAVYRTLNELQQHMQSQHMHNEICDVCGVVCVYGGLKYHKIRMHSTNREFICDSCNQTFTTKSRLETHMVKHSALTAKSMTYCSKCKVQLKNLVIYRKHMRARHDMNSTRIKSTKREFICDSCNQTFTTKRRLETHMAKHKEKSMSYCNKCKVQFKNVVIYRKHLIARHENSTYACPACGKLFSTMQYLRRHHAFMHVRDAKYMCELCDKTFMLPYQLRKHNQVHHGLFRSRDHACNECGKKFFTLQMLSNHQTTHSGTRPYMCAHCGDTFKQQSALWTHTKLKHKEKKCDE